LKKTCFYAESGGQVSDTGMIVGKNFKARVLDVFKAPNGQHVHKVKLLDGIITIKDDCDLILDREKREMTEHNHSSVHILQNVLQEVLSHDVHQAGSFVNDDRLRFDFTYTSKILEDDLLKIEQRVNDIINSSLTTITEEMKLEDAKKLGAMALFSEKYKDNVRVVRIGESLELCGGTHVKNTKDISNFAILSCESKGSNVYRIEAVTGNKIEDALFQMIKPYNDEMIKLLMKAKTLVGKAKQEGINLTFNVEIDHSKPTSYKDIIYNKNELSYIQSEVRNLEKTYLQAKEKKALENVDDFLENVIKVNEINTLIMKLKGYDINILKGVMDEVLNKLGKGFIFFALVKDDNTVNFLARSNINTNAGLVVKDASIRSLGNGGGSQTFAQGGGKSIDNLDEILESIKKDIC